MARILIVDDSKDYRDSLAAILRASGHEVTTVADGHEALVYVLHDLPDVVLLDLAMPEMDGLSFLEVIRSYVRLHSIPVVISTGLGESLMIDRARQLHVNAVLVKGKASPTDVIHALEEAAVHQTC